MGHGGKRESSGRKPGKPSRRTVEVMETLDRLKCDPIEGMARIAAGDVPCMICNGKGRFKFSAKSGTLEPDPVNGVLMTCILCLGRGKELTPTKVRADMYAELAQYIFPKRKAIDHTSNGQRIGTEVLLPHVPGTD